MPNSQKLPITFDDYLLQILKPRLDELVEEGMISYEQEELWQALILKAQENKRANNKDK